MSRTVKIIVNDKVMHLRTAKAQDSKTETYGFDAIDQVTDVSYTGGTASTRSVAYNYDATGNRTSVVDNGIAQNYSTNNLNQYTTVFGSGLGYDGNGNLTASPSNGLSALHFYDAQNRLVKSIVGASTMEFFYDSKNRVVKRTLNGVPTYLVYDGWSLIEERTSTGSVSARYVHGTNIDEILAKTDSSGTVYYHHDGLGSTTMLTDSTGFTLEKYSYDIFGKVSISGATSQQLLATSSYGNRFYFTGREFLKEVGLYDYRNRVYSENLGRFLQTDPILFNAGDVNIYRYCGNNGVNSTDAFGLDEKRRKENDDKWWKDFHDGFKDLNKDNLSGGHTGGGGGGGNNDGGYSGGTVSIGADLWNMNWDKPIIPDNPIPKPIVRGLQGAVLGGVKGFTEGMAKGGGVRGAVGGAAVGAVGGAVAGATAGAFGW